MHIIISVLIHLIGFGAGLLICSLILPVIKINDDTNDNEIIFEFEYVEELEELLDSKKEESPIIKTNIITLDIPFLNNTVVMYYDTDKNAFCYYTKGDIIYKYLNVVCRKYVIDFNCPSLYKEDTSHYNTNTNTNTNMNMFIKKIERPTLDKDINKFILCGSLEDYAKIMNTSNVEVKDININEYLSQKFL